MKTLTFPWMVDLTRNNFWRPSIAVAIQTTCPVACAASSHFLRRVFPQIEVSIALYSSLLFRTQRAVKSYCLPRCRSAANRSLKPTQAAPCRCVSGTHQNLLQTSVPPRRSTTQIRNEGTYSRWISCSQYALALRRFSFGPTNSRDVHSGISGFLSLNPKKRTTSATSATGEGMPLHWKKRD